MAIVSVWTGARVARSQRFAEFCTQVHWVFVDQLPFLHDPRLLLNNRLLYLYNVIHVILRSIILPVISHYTRRHRLDLVR